MKLSLSFKEAKTLSQHYNVIPLHASCILDLDTPVSLYIKSGAWKKPYSFLLESVVGGENRGRYSYIGISHYATIKGKNSFFEIVYPSDNMNVKEEHTHKKKKIEASDPLKALALASSSYKLFQPDELSGFYAGLLGFFSYDIVHYYESIAEKNKAHSEDARLNPLQIDDMIYVIPRLIIWLDHVMGKIRLIRNLFISTDNLIASEYAAAEKEINHVMSDIHSEQYRNEYKKLTRPIFQEKPDRPWECNTDRDSYLSMIQKAKDYIRTGDIFQVVLSKRFYQKYPYDPFFLYRGLRVTNPSPYMFYLNFPEVVLIGSSPEILIKKQDNKVILRPIAGTIRRGKNIEEDKLLSQTLLDNPKERAEHVMLVDLGRNDMGRICKFGSISIDEYMSIEKYSHVMHIVSNLLGELKKNATSFDSIMASFPAGTVSGAPKVRAMQIIEELEKEARGPYSGCVGYFNFNGDMDTAITLRTMWVKNNTLYVQAGAGIVFDSTPEGEDAEAFRKSQAIFQAVETFYRGELERRR